MKKMFLIFSIFSLLLNPLSAMLDLPNPIELTTQNKDQTKFQKLLSKLSVVQEKLSNAPEKVKTLFNWTSNQLDTILTKKGVIKTLLILGPLFTTYCYFFPPEIIATIITKFTGAATKGASDIANATINGLKNNKDEIKSLAKEIMKEVGEMQTTANLNQEIGQMQATWNALYENPLATTSLLAFKGIEKLWFAGIPFALGLLTRNMLKPATNILPTP